MDEGEIQVLQNLQKLITRAIARNLSYEAIAAIIERDVKNKRMSTEQDLVDTDTGVKARKAN
jgi:hypothetical protein